MRLFFVVLSCAATIASAAPRLVFMEEATNANCSPCAAQNPIMQAFLVNHPGQIICIRYHANWPGPSDPMYLTTPTDNLARINYYGIKSVPMGAVDGALTPGIKYGGYTGSVGSGPMLDSLLRARMAVASPCRVTVAESRSGSVATVTVTVIAEQALSNVALRIAAIQSVVEDPNAGTNGETEFENVMRAMMPNAGGTTFSAAAGDSLTFTQSYTIAAAWDTSRLFTVAWIQDDNTKEIVQSGMSTQPFSLALSQSWITSRDGAGSLSSSVSITNPATDPRTVTLTLTPAIPSDWSGQFYVGETPSGESVTLTVGAGSTERVKVVVQTPSQGAGAVTITTSDRIFPTEKTIRVYRDVPALVVDDDNQITAENYFASALKANYLPEGVVPQGDVIANPAILKEFPAVVWEVSKGILTGPDVDVLKAFLDGGGRLYLSGAEIAWGLGDAQSSASGGYPDPVFLGSYLHVGYVQDDVGTTSAALRTAVHGVAGDPITDGMASALSGKQLTSGTYQPDELAAADPQATVIAWYGTSGTTHAAAVRVAGRYAMVYDAFGQESMDNIAARDTYMHNILQWLSVNGPSAVNAAEPTPFTFALEQNYPNPFNPSTRLTFEVPKTGEARLAITDALGREVAVIASGTFDAGMHMATFDAHSLPSGTYVATFTCSGRTVTREMTLIK